MKPHPIPALLLALLTATPAPADPAWWDSRGVTTNDPASNLAPATIGQAKHMAAMALEELETRLTPQQFAALQTDVAAVVDLAVPQPKSPAFLDQQHEILLNGQLKALAKPFYDHLRALDAAWLDAEMTAAGTRVEEPDHSGYSPYPWTESTADDANLSPTTLGQLKAVFALRFENLSLVDPPPPDSDGDGIPDVWELAHGLDPNNPADVHGLFQGGPLTYVQAFRAGVQANPAATLADLDGDGVPNEHDADPLNDTIRWPRGASPAWMVRFPNLFLSDSSFGSLSANGVVVYSNNLEWHVLNPQMDLVTIPMDPQLAGSFFPLLGLSTPLHGDRLFGKNLVSSDPYETEWAYYHAMDGLSTNPNMPEGNPPEIIYDATNRQVSGVGGGFGLRADGETPLFGSAYAGYFESNENAVSVDPGGMRYWTYGNGELDSGRLVSPSATWPTFHQTAGSPTATVMLPIGQSPPVAHHLVPAYNFPAVTLYVAEACAAFTATTFPAPLLAPLSATRQGWLIDATWTEPRLWLNGHWHPFANHVPPRAGDNAPLEIRIDKARDTGIIAATARHAGETDWKHAILTPIHLQIHHPQQNTTVPWNDYLPGYVLDEPVLCKAMDATRTRSFENLDYNGPQEVNLRFSGPAIELADSITLEIKQVSNHPGWSQNAGNSQEEDLSFAAGSDDQTATVSVTDGTATIPIYCKDYAAWAKFHLTLTKNGTVIHPDPIVLTLPHDANGDRIADHWQRSEIRKWNEQFRQKAGDPDWINPNDPNTWPAIFGSQGEADAELADSDGPGPMPAMADDGDGLSALEEYRGFFLDGGPTSTTPRHRRLSVARKELLVECSEMEGIASTTLRLPSDANANFTDQGNDPNAFAQAYSLTTTMSRISSFFAQEGAPVGNNPKYFPGAAIDTWWVTDKLNDMGYVVYENGAMGATHKYSGPYKDLQRPNDATRDRIGWLSIASDHNLAISNPVAFSNLYGGNSQGNAGGQGVAVLGNYGNRNNRCAHFIKLAVQGRKGFKSTNGNFYAKSGDAAREQDERHEHRATHQGAAIFVNSLSEEPDLVDQTAFEGRLEWCIAHELAHLFVVNDDNHFDGSGIVLSKTREVGLSKFVEDEIVNTKLRQRASINRDANGNPQP